MAQPGSAEWQALARSPSEQAEEGRSGLSLSHSRSSSNPDYDAGESSESSKPSTLARTLSRLSFNPNSKQGKDKRPGKPAGKE